jgi:NTP pyrophosphatase (non-canonical NTP hydrolase)
MSLDQNTIETLRALQRKIGQANAEKGFHDEGNRLRELRETADLWMLPGELTNEQLNYYTARLALITTEVAEAIEELRNGGAVDATWYSAKTGLGTLAFDNRESIDHALLPDGVSPKPEGVPSELADVVIRAFDFADEAGIDLAAIVDEKLAYNATRAKMHGRKF